MEERGEEKENRGRGEGEKRQTGREGKNARER